MDRFGICIVGAGVIGLAIACRIAAHPRYRRQGIVLLEQESGIGQHTSSRNSEVIHAGIYYPTDSLKAELCVRGKQLLYEHCQRYEVDCRRIGKLIIGQHGDAEALESLRLQAQANGVDDLAYLDARQLAHSEPALKGELALLSPSSGILDSHGYMESLLVLAQQAGVQFAPFTRVEAVTRDSSDYVVETRISAGGDVETYRFACEQLVNSAGLLAQELAGLIPAVPASAIPALHYCKGDYFSYQGKSPFQRLVYPLPERNLAGLGIHATLDLGGQLKFGPDAEYVTTLDYAVNADKAMGFADAISRYFPGISAQRLSPAYAGIRPKLAAAGEPAADFVIQDGRDYGLDGLVQLFGIESPGLTASLAVGDLVGGMLLD